VSTLNFIFTSSICHSSFTTSCSNSSYSSNHSPHPELPRVTNPPNLALTLPVISTYAETLYAEVYSVRQGLIDMWKDGTMHVLMKIYLNDINLALTFVMKIATNLEDKAVVLLRCATCEVASARAVEEFDWIHNFFS
jgi:hypothetical protein